MDPRPVVPIETGLITELKRPSPLGIRLIGSFKLISAVLLVLLGYGIFREIGNDPAIEAKILASALKLDPQNHYIHSAINAISGVSKGQLYALSAGTFIYAILYAIEGMGLILQKKWGEYFTIFMTGLLIPVEAYEVIREPEPLRVSILALNVAIVAYLIVQLRRTHRLEKAAKGAPVSLAE